MARPSLDPAPRQYAAAVKLTRRAANGPPAAGNEQSPDAIEQWLLYEALQAQDMLTLTEQFCWRLTVAGIPIARLALNVGTLHPQLAGFSWIWEADDDFCDEIRVEMGSLQHPSYTRSPLYRTLEFGETIHGDPRNPELAARYPIMTDLAARGFADYLVAPLTPSGGLQQHRMAVSMASMQEGGLSGANGDVLHRLLRLLALHAARLTAVVVSQNISAAYLGEAAGKQVLEGSIARGTGAPIDAVILVSDLRGFTELSGRLPPDKMLALLNAQFEALVEAIADRGGEVLKFMGDGLLAVFPVEHPGQRRETAAHAFEAAQNALTAVAAFSENPPEALAETEGWRPLRIGLALHAGEVFFGNVGAPDRLDFTVIGPAVNIAARVESMTKELNRPLLVTEPVARLLGAQVEPLGSHLLRGITEPVALFAPSE